MIESFSEEYPDITVTAEYTGSGAGLEAVAAGKTDIGNSSRALKDSEKAAGVEENIVAIDGIAVIANKAGKVLESDHRAAQRHLYRQDHQLEGTWAAMTRPSWSSAVRPAPAPGALSKSC